MRDPFQTEFARNTYYRKYALSPNQHWFAKCADIVADVCGKNHTFRSPLMSDDDRKYLQRMLENMWFLPGGRYIYYAGRLRRFWNNCMLFRVEADTREAWASLTYQVMAALMTGAGVGVDYSIARGKGLLLRATGGEASGPISLMKAINELGRQVMQGGSRRSAIYASLDWDHADICEFMMAKNWDNMEIGSTGVTIGDLKREDFNHPAPLDMTNISVNFNTEFLERFHGLPKGVLKGMTRGELINKLNNFDRAFDPKLMALFMTNLHQAMTTGDPGFSFNFGEWEGETLRNACTEISSRDDSDVCNLGSLNLARIPDLTEFERCVDVATKFLVCGTARAELPYEKVYDIRDKNRRLGLGLMGVHEWLLTRGHQYEMVDELHKWMGAYQTVSNRAAYEHCDRLFLSHPIAKRAIAPTGTISILAGPTTSGIEPLFAAAYLRRYLQNGVTWMEEAVIDPVAQKLVEQMGVDPNSIETAMDLANDPGRRIKFQADMQLYVDQCISSTINLPHPDHLTEEAVGHVGAQLIQNMHCLRGITMYPDGARGGQPLTPMDYHEAKAKLGVVKEAEVCKGGVCGV